MRDKLERQLIGDEGVEPCVYKDTLGYDTIGIGRLVDKRKQGAGAGLRPKEITFLFNNDVDDRVESLNRRLSWFKDLDEVRQGALLNMSFQLGVEGLLNFRTTLGLIKEGQYAAAEKAMLQSLWAKQTPARAKRIAKQVRTGEWQFSN